MSKLGYARVSTKEQNLNRQLDELERYGVDRLFRDEGGSGSKKPRPALDEMLAYAREGDTVVITKLDRLGRNLSDLLNLSAELEQRKVNLVSLVDSIDTTTVTGRFVFQLLGALAEMERSRLIERTNDGLKAARARGRVGGRKPALTAKQVQQVRTLRETMTIREIAEVMGVGKSTIERTLRPPQ